MENNKGFSIISCKYCPQKLRVPNNIGELIVTCPVCKSKFEFKPETMFERVIKNIKKPRLYLSNWLPKALFGVFLCIVVYGLFITFSDMTIDNKSKIKDDVQQVVTGYDPMFRQQIDGGHCVITIDNGKNEDDYLIKVFSYNRNPIECIRVLKFPRFDGHPVKSV